MYFIQAELYVFYLVTSIQLHHSERIMCEEGVLNRNFIRHTCWMMNFFFYNHFI